MSVVDKYGCGFYNKTLMTWLNLIATPSYREVHDCVVRKEQARKQLNRIGEANLEVQLKTIGSIACYISAPVDEKVCAKKVFFNGLQEKLQSGGLPP